jgi:hypothetical protein
MPTSILAQAHREKKSATDEAWTEHEKKLFKSVFNPCSIRGLYFLSFLCASALKGSRPE